MNRITANNLQQIVDRINKLAGTPLQPYANGKPQALCYHLEGAYGGWQLSQMAKSGTGTRNVLRCGFETKRELARLMNAFADGLETHFNPQP